MSQPVLINDGKGWRLDPPKRRRYFQPAGITSVRVRRLMEQGYDTHQIAEMNGINEAVVWNALARAGT